MYRIFFFSGLILNQETYNIDLCHLQEEKLVNDLKKDLKFKKNLQFLNLEKSAGVFSRSSDFRKTLRNSNIQVDFSL